MYFLFIIFSALLDIVANLMLKKSNGFTNKFYGLLSIMFAIVAFLILSFSLKYIELSVAYATWGAIGILGTSLGGFLFYKERLNKLGIFGIFLTITAVVLLNL